MKQIITALLIAGLTYSGAQAQEIQVCGVKKDKVCRLTANKKVSCYKTKYAENFKVCKDDLGYRICCETRNSYNSTQPAVIAVEVKKPMRVYTYQNDNTRTAVAPVIDMTLPQSQSYTVTNSNVYEGYYPEKGHIIVCYTGDNVAELNHAPYEGCPSPASEGPEVNRQRNVNVSNPEPMPPLAGTPY